MPKFLEDKLKKEYGANSDVPYKIMNSMGVMRGNKETAKGKAMDAKHNKTAHNPPYPGKVEAKIVYTDGGADSQVITPKAGGMYELESCSKQSQENYAPTEWQKDKGKDKD